MYDEQCKSLITWAFLRLFISQYMILKIKIMSINMHCSTKGFFTGGFCFFFGGGELSIGQKVKVYTYIPRWYILTFLGIYLHSSLTSAKET